MASYLDTRKTFETALFGEGIGKEVIASSNTIKACLFTLIVLVKDLEHTFLAQDLIQLITKKLPCKIILVNADPSTQETFLEKESSCRIIGDNSSKVLCDVVSIHVSANQMAAIPFLILPEIIPDLPVYVLIEHDPIEFQSILNLLEPYVHRIIIDIPHLYNIGQYAQHLLSMKHREKFVGLNWVRTKPWRDSFSNAFYSEEALQTLCRSNRIEVHYVFNPDVKKSMRPDTQAIMFISWLASRLKWRPIQLGDEKESLQIIFASENREIIVTLSPTTNTILEEGNIASIEITADEEVHYLFSYEHDDKNIVVHASSKDRCEMPYTLFVGSYRKSRQLPKEIFQQKISAHYIPTLEIMASEIWHKDRHCIALQV